MKKNPQAPSHIVDASTHAPEGGRKLVRQGPRPMALEQRFMFDGAVAGDVAQVLSHGAADLSGRTETQRSVSPAVAVRETTAPAAPAAAANMLQIQAAPDIAVPEALSTARTAAQQAVLEFLSGPDAKARLFEAFNGGTGSPSAEWSQAADSLLAALQAGDYTVQVELRSNAELRGAMGAFASAGPDGRPVIYLNADWVQTFAGATELKSVLIEEIGHSFDAWLNRSSDTAGDEGQRFAALVAGQDVSSQGFATDNDQIRLTLDGAAVDVERASYTFVNAYQVNTATTPAGKESNSHDFVYTATPVPVSIDDGNFNGALFSGNDVSATALQINGVDYFGWISRPIKVGGDVKGFYFWTDADFTNLAAAQADGNSDGDGNVADNSAFVLVVNQAYFTALAGSAADGSILNVGSSSDRVDTALNSLVTANAAPVATNDLSNGTPGLSGGAAVERGFNSNTSVELVATVNATGNVLANDSDPGDTITVSQVKSNASNATVSVGGAPGVLAGRYGTLTLNANGTYSYAVDNANPAVDALLTGGTLSDAFTYTVSDGKGGTASATLTVQIRGSNDAPVAQTDYNSAKESTTVSGSGFLYTGYSASGNVLGNDTDVDSGDGKSIQGLAINGAATVGTVSVTAGSLQLVFLGSQGFTSVTGGEELYISLTGATGNSVTYNGVYAYNAGTATYTLVNVLSKTAVTGGDNIVLSATPTHYWNGSSYVSTGDLSTFFTTYNKVLFSNSTAQTRSGNNGKEASVSSSAATGSTTLTGLGGLDGTIAVGMTATGAGVPASTRISSLTYDGAGAITGIVLDKELSSTAGGAFTFTGSVAIGQTLAGAHGTLVLASNGTYTYTATADNPNLAGGQSATEVFDYTMVDTNGATSASKLYITVYGTGSNDPVVVADTATAYESGVGRGPTAPYALTGDNTAFGGANASAITSLTGVLGNDTSSAGGVVASYTKADGTGSVSAGGNLVGAYGTLNIGASGTYTYTVANGNATVDALLPGSTLTETFRYRVTNTALGSNWSTLTVTIQGTNDGPVAVSDAAGLTEDAVLTASGNVLGNDTDIDSGDTKVVSRAGTSSANTAVTASTTAADGLSVGGTYGTLTIGADGTYQYVLATSADATRYAALQALTDGTTAPEVFRYEVKDGNGATSVTTLTFTITGANEPPVNAYPSAVATGVDTPLAFTLGNLISVSDADGNLSKLTLNVDHGILAVTLSGAATVTAGASGSSTLTLSGSAADINDTLASLIYTPGSGYTGADSLTIFSQDSLFAFDSDAIDITISNTNVAPDARDNAYGALEDTTLNGNVISDADSGSGADVDANGDALTVIEINGVAVSIGTPIALTHGTLTITNADGSFSYLPTAGSTAGDSFSYTVSDGNGDTDTATVTITVTAVNDAPAGADKTITTLEDTAYTLASADFGFSDADDTPADALLAVKITALPTSGTLTLDGVAVTVGQIVGVTDIAANKLVFTPASNANGTAQANFKFAVQDDGGTANSGADLDASPNTITFNVTAVNDAPVIAGDATGAVTEDAATPTLTDTGTLTISDADTGESAFQTTGITASAGALGGLSITSGGAWTYTVDNALAQYLKAGETKVETFTVKSVDGTTQDVVVTITGVNDAPVIAGDSVGAVTEDAATPTLTDTGTLSISDADTGEAAFQTTGITASAGALGSLSIISGGTWTYTVDNALVQYLKAGETKTETFTVTSIDGTTQDVVVTITGVNDAPAIAGDATGAVTEDAATPTLTDTGTLSISDADTGEAAFQTTGITASAGALGGLSITSGGAWTYTVDNALVQYLKAGETKTETFTVKSADGTTQDVVVTITGINDAPAIAGDATGAVTEDAATPTLTDTGTLTISDADTGEAAFQTTGITASAGALGALSITSGGAWTYTVDNALVQYLKAGETKTETFTVTSIDGTTQDVVVTITGVNDAPAIAGDATGAVTEDAATPTLTDTGTLTISDADNGEDSFQTTGIIASAGALGSLNITSGGAWTYTVDNSLVQYLKAGETKTETFTVTSIDGTTQDVVVTITGINDAPAIAGDATGAVTEDAATPTLTDIGTLTISDADTGEAAFQTTGITASAGALGSLSITSGGAWTYTVNNALVQYLKAGETKTETFTVKSADGTTQDVVVTITGVNDAPVIAGDATGAVTEDAATPTLTDTGTLTISDSDAGEASFQTTGISASAGALGGLSITSGGAWTYTVDNALVQYLKAGETKTETFTVTSIDGTTQDVVATITGINDAPVIAGDSVGAVTEDAATPTLTDTGTLTISDADTGEAAFQTTGITASTGALGSLSITSGGAWTYTVDNALVQYLKAGETKTETFTVKSADGATHDIVVTITGVNDAPAIAGDSTGAVTEDAAIPTLTDTGTLTISDSDTGEAAFQTTGITASAGALGSLSVTSGGAWTYTVDNALVQYLKAGETKTETFTVTSIDGTTQDVVVTITGINDAPVIAGDSVGAVTEDASTPTLTDTGTLTISDADTGESAFQATGITASAGALGSLTISSGGAWTYAVDNGLVQYLKAGETKVETFTVKSADGTTQDVVVTITGVNDAPAISGDSVGAVTEDASTPALTDTGTLTISDADTGESAFQTTGITASAGALGSLSITSGGTWTYTVDNALVQYLKAGETKVETFTVNSIDGTTHDIEVTITGVNDVPVIGGDATGAVTEDASAPTLTDTGALTISDAVTGEDYFQTTGITASAGALGSLSITSGGAWTYTVDNALVQYLKAGQSKVETFTVKSADGTTRDVVVTITGVNDAPLISGDSVGEVTEDSTTPTLTDIGSLAISDADTGEGAFQTTGITASAGALGSLSITSGGAWTYTVDNSLVQYLKAGETKTETFTVTSIDGTTQDVVVTITGVNDAPAIAGDATGAVTEDAATPTLTDTGTLSISDADTGEAAFQTTGITASAGALGGLSITSGGAWTYTVDNALVQYLKAGETKTETFTVESADGTTQDVVVTITGINDAPAIAGDATGAVTEDAATPTLTDTGTLTISDADTGEAAFQTTGITASAGALGALSITSGGAWTYTVDNALVQYLKAGETKTETFTVTSIDGTTQDVVVTITGINDAPAIAGDATGAVTEDAATPTLTDTGTLTISDADTGEAAFQTTGITASAGALGSLSITSGGAWTYTVDNAQVQYLKAGETKTETFTVTSIDGTTQDVVVTITGVNDAPVIAGDATGAVTEDAAIPTLTDTGTLTISDSDTGEAAFQTTGITASAGALGSLSIISGGTWTYTVDNALVQYLKAGETKTETFTVTSIDGTTQDVVVTITGVNDAPAIAGDATGAVTEDASTPTLTDTGTLTISDADNGEDSFQTTGIIASAGALGSLSITSGGAWTYTVDNALVQYLKAGETKTETFTVTSIDGTTQDVVVTITGVNDAPAIAGDATGAVTEDAATPTLTDTGTLTISDADNGEDSFQTTGIIASAGALGSLNITSGGAWTYTVDNSLVQYLKAGETKTETFTVTSIDGTTQDVVVTISGVNDAPAIAGDATGAVTEDAATPTLTDTGALTISDADTGEAAFQTTGITASAGALGALSITSGGAWTYTVDNSLVQYLKAGETKTETFTVTSIDGTTQDVVVTITGVNDTPAIAGDATGAVTEDDTTPTLTDTGTLTISDDDTDEDAFQTDPASIAASAGALGSLSITSGSVWTYTVDNALVQYLKAGETKTETFTVKSVDGTTQDVVVTITGVNDAPVIAGDATGAVTEDASAPTLTDTGALTISDADTAESAFQTAGIMASAGALGSLSITSGGAWTYTVDNALVQYLKAGETKTETFTVKSVDGTTQDVVVTINGVNDTPAIGGDATGVVTEDAGVVAGALSAAGSLTIGDADADQSAFLTSPADITSAPGTLGALAIDASGDWVYTVDNAAAQFLQAGETQVETFTVRTLDGTTKTISITIIGVDEPAPSVNSVVVNEASSFAIFEVTGQSGLSLTLALTAGSAFGGGTDFGDPGARNLSFSVDAGVTWLPYAGTATIPAGGLLLVRTPLTNDGDPDNNESFTLTATNADGLSGSGTGTIKDDGTGTIFNPDGSDDLAAPRDDDRRLTVESIVVNEASPFAVFQVTGAAGQLAFLAFPGGSATGGGTDYGPALEVSTDGGVTWVAYTAAGVNLNGSGSVLVRTPITPDDLPDDGEAFTLSASNTGGTAGTGTATIRDDGTGDIFKPDGSIDADAVKDDDRPLAVNSMTVSESSPFVVFVVSGQPGQLVALALQSGTATVGDDTGTAMQYFDGSAWRDVVPGALVPIPAGGTTLLVRVAIVDNLALEGPETFSLVVRNTGGQAATGVATISDDGTSGNRFEAGNATGTPTQGPADDDRAPPAAATPDLPPPPAAFVPVLTFDPVTRPPQVFDSALFVSRASTLPLPERPAIGEILTSGTGFRAVVIESEQAALMLFRGITDQFVEFSRAATFSLPADAFAHTRPEVVLSLDARLTTGEALPSWVLFDAQAGTFLVTPPAGFSGQLEVKVTARDSEGREASAVFKLNVGSAAKSAQAPGRSGLTDQIRLAAQRGALSFDSLRGPAEAAKPARPVAAERAPVTHVVRDRV